MKMECLTTQALIALLEGAYYSIVAANPDYETTLWHYLRGADIAPDDIWEYSPEIGWNANQSEPDWL